MTTERVPTPDPSPDRPTHPEVDLDAVAAAVRTVATEVILPRFRALAEADVTEKSPGELVTVADVEAEQALTRRLIDLLPGAVVIGEEAVSADPSLLDEARSSPKIWVIDSIDGTSNFVDGSPDFAVMVALIESGTTTASWIHHPVADRTFIAVRGGGAWGDGQRLIRTPASSTPSDLHGVLITRLLDRDTAARVDQRMAGIGRQSENRRAAGINYPLVAEGELDFVFCWRTLVWDHAAGALLLEEAGGRVARLDGTDYEPWSDRTGLVFAADPATHHRVISMLAPTGTI